MPATYKNIGLTYAEVFNAYRQATLSYQAGISALIEKEKEVAKTKESYGLALSDARIDGDKAAAKIAQSMLERMIWLAQAMFAPEGGSLTIDKTVVIEALGYETKHHWEKKKASWADFDAERAWDYLESNYGGEMGQEEGHRQTAAAIADVFYLKKGKPVKTVGGRTVLDITVYIDSLTKKYNNVNRISYNCTDRINKALISLRAFAVWAGLDELASALSSALQVIGNHNREVESRASYCHHGISIITYLNRFEFRFDPSVAEQLQIFLGMYALESMREAA